MIFNQNNTSTPATDRPAAQHWLNIGKTMPVVNEKTGETEQKFISIPVGIPLDTMEAMETNGNSKSWKEQVGVKNAILKFLQEGAANLSPGEGELVEGLEIQIYSKGEKTAPVADADNSLLKQLDGIKIGA